MCLKYLTCFLFLTIVLIQALDHKCPPSQDIFSCSCDFSFDRSWVTCNKLQRVDDLIEAVAGLKGREIFSFRVENSYIGDLPGDLFKGANIKFIRFVNTALTSVGDKENPPFTGLENSLISLNISGKFLDKNKPLTEPIRLGHLQKLFSMTLDNIIIPEITDDLFADVPLSLRYLTISNCRVKKVGHSAFTKLKNLYSLKFSGNSVSLERSVIADNPTSLYTIDLSNNGLEELPSDLFTNMPALDYISLDNNHITHLPVDVWKPLLKQLRTVSIESNPFICDQRIKEFVKENLHNSISGECASPPKLARRTISYLKLSDIED